MPLLRIFLLASAALVSSCDRSQEQPATTPSNSPEAEIPSLQLAEAPIDREALLIAVLRAASNFSTGKSDVEEQRQLDGMRFKVRLRIGCLDDSPEFRNWTFNEEERVLRIRAEPQISQHMPSVEQLGYKGFEAVEGFLVRRPWLLQAACPAKRQTTETVVETKVPPSGPREVGTASGPLIGIAQFYTDEDSRSLRRGKKAYEATVKLSPEQKPSATGYDLVLSGRMAQLPDGRVIACTADVAGPPSCIVSVAFDHVAMQVPGGDVLADWGG